MKHAVSTARSYAIEADGVGTLTLLYGVAVTNGIRVGSPLPARIKVLNWGVNKTLKGDVVVNDLTAARLPDFQREMNWDDIVLDIEHGSVPGSPLFRSAAENGKFPELLGRGRPLVLSGDGLYVDGIVWSPHGARAYEFPDLSPAVKQDANGVVIGMHSTAFCVHGATFDLHAYSAHNNHKEIIVMKSVLLKLLSLEDNAADAAMTDRAGKIADGLTALVAIPPDVLARLAAMPVPALAMLSALSAETIDAIAKLSAADVQAKLKLLSTIGDGQKETLQAALTRLSVAESTVKDLHSQFVESRRNQLLLLAASQGKVVPRVYLDKHGDDIATLSTLIEQLPVTVPVDQRTNLLSLGTPGGGKPTPTDVETMVAKRFGRKPEDLTKSGV